MKQDKTTLPASRARLASVLRAAKEVVSVDIASKTLGMERREAAKLLSRWQGQGWLRRIGHGLYVGSSQNSSSMRLLSLPRAMSHGSR
jgi:predicted transcriptional regulator of viral defense system